MTTTVLAVVGLIWRRLRRDRLGLAFSFLLPVAVAVVMVGIYSTDYASVGVVDSDGSVGEGLFRRLEDDGLVEVRHYDTRAEVEQAVRRREVAAGVVVPMAAGSGGTTEVDLIGPPGVEAPSSVRAVVEAAVAETAAALRLGQAIDPGAPPDTALRTGGLALSDAPRQPLSGDTANDRRHELTAEALIGTLVLFVFVNTVGGASSLAELRELGILARARTTSAPSVSIALGYGLGVTSYALVQAGLMLATGWLVFGVVWAAWPALLVVVAVTAVCAGALTVLIATLLPSPELGMTVAGPAAFLLGMLGGCLWPLDIVNPKVAAAGHLTPHAWAIEALQAVGIAGESLPQVASQLGLLVGGAAVLVALGGWRLHRIAAQA